MHGPLLCEYRFILVLCIRLAAKRILLLVYSYPFCHFILFWQILFIVVIERTELKVGQFSFSQSKIAVCPPQSGFVLFVQTCFTPLSCPVLSHSVLFLNRLGSSWPWEKGNLFLSDMHLPSYQPLSKSKLNAVCTSMAANTQKNADSLCRSLPSWHTHTTEICFVDRRTPTEDVRVLCF